MGLIDAFVQFCPCIKIPEKPKVNDNKVVPIAPEPSKLTADQFSTEAGTTVEHSPSEMVEIRAENDVEIEVQNEEEAAAVGEDDEEGEFDLSQDMVYDQKYDKLYEEYEMRDFICHGTHSSLRTCLYKRTNQIRVLKYTARNALSEVEWKAKINEINILR